MQAQAVQSVMDLSAPILVIDDHEMMVELITRIVRHLGYENVDHAGDGLTALLMMTRRDYRLVISDWQMQPVSGLDLLRAIRTDRRLGKTKFLMMTARMNAEDALAAKEAGVDNFILKPFTPEALQAKIAEIL